MVSEGNGWRDRIEVERDVVTESPLRRMAATLDIPTPAGVPTLWHWLFCLPTDPTSTLGDDGHRRHERISETVEGTRRMYAGGDIHVLDPLRIGDAVERRSRIADVTEKTGRSGPLAFVTVRHEWSTDRGLAITEDQSLVYTDAPPVTPGEPSDTGPPPAEWVDEVHPDERVLFRFSALTFNTHRIHYDAPHTTDVEGYPGLLVHGPLLAVLLAGLGERHLGPATAFRFRAVSPVLVGTTVVLTGDPSASGTALAAWTNGGRKAMEATFHR